jgi:hypothetical protein
VPGRSTQSLDCMSRHRREGFRCQCCGKWHNYAPTDMGFQLPDDAWSMPQEQREKRLVANEDLCAIDRKRFFVRCVLMVPFNHTDGYFGWGLWAEVSKRDFFRYHDNHSNKGEKLRSFPGRIANALPGYRSLLGKPVILLPGPKTQRPTLRFPSQSRHLLAREQRAGVDAARHHQMLHENMHGAVQ